MNYFKIAWNYIKDRKTQSILTVLSVAMGACLTIIVVFIRIESSRYFMLDYLGYQAIVGAKGSSLQLVLNTVFYHDVPTGNIPYSYYKKIKNMPSVRDVIAVSIGDSYHGYKIIGTEEKFFKRKDKYDKELKKLERGRFFTKPFEVVIGAEAAQKTGLKIGAEFYGSHGLLHHGKHNVHKSKRFRVVGILERTGTPDDRALFTDYTSYWDIHEKREKELTAILVSLRTPASLLSFPRYINKNTPLMAALPSREIFKLMKTLGAGQNALMIIAGLVFFGSLLSVIVSVYANVLNRFRDILVMRSLGAGKLDMLSMVLIESSIITFTGAVLGWIIARLSIIVISDFASKKLGFYISPFSFYNVEILAVFMISISGLVAGVVPGVKAYGEAEFEKNLNRMS